MDDLKLPLNIPPWAVAGVAAALWAGWDRVKSWATQLLTHLVCVATMDTDLGFFTAERIYHMYGISRFGRKGMLLKNVPTADGGRAWVVSRWLPNSDTVIWVPCTWATWLKLPVGITITNGNVVVTYLRGTFNLEGLIDSILEEANAWKEGRFRVIRLVGSSGEAHTVPGMDMHKPVQSVGRSHEADENFFVKHYRGMDLQGSTYTAVRPEVPRGGPEDLWLCNETQHCLEDARRWLKARPWYKSTGLAWRRGVLLHGLAGVGKTSLTRAIAIDLDLPICLIDLGSMNNQDLDDAWNTVQENAPCIVLLEDIDGVYTGRSPTLNRVAGSGPPTFDCLLNRLDGADRNNGIFCVITSNDLNKVDTALGGRLLPSGSPSDYKDNVRPGRIDRVVRLPDHITMDGKVALGKRLLGADYASLLPAHVLAEPMTPAQFQEQCVAAALAMRET